MPFARARRDRIHFGLRRLDPADVRNAAFSLPTSRLTMWLLSDTLPERVAAFITRTSMANGVDRIGVAVSARADSVLLFHMLNHMRARASILNSRWCT